ncbi:MAG: aminopeptidase P family protein [Planctomycetota bacterium]|nr:MAG: aminopeptidase P family protein [Planctomycetota bacterium]
MNPAIDPYHTDPAASRTRQQRLLGVMRREKLDYVILTQNAHIQYFVGPRFGWTFSPAAALAGDGRMTLVAPSQPKDAAADDVRTYEAQSFSTLRNDQRHKSTDVLLDALKGKTKSRRVGVEGSSCGPEITARLEAMVVDVEPQIYEMRRRKDPDELAKIKKAIDGTAAMHRRAREMIAPGVNELDVFNELQAAAVREYGEMLTGTGNDYACGVPGGPPRDRPIEAGELYILDLGPAFRGYFADNTRVTAVGGKPTDAQLEAHGHIVQVFDLVEKEVKPGKSCRELFEQVHAYLNQKPWEFEHHLGHGIGLFPHEAPHLNPCWDDTFQEGEVFAVEPGLYGEPLRAGIRLENNYLVTADGVELLTPFPLEL